MIHMPEEFQKIPIVQISLPGVRAETYLMKQERYGNAKAKVALELGRALKTLRSQGVLIIGTGRVNKNAMHEDNLEKWCKGLKRTCCECPLEDRWKYLQRWEELPCAR